MSGKSAPVVELLDVSRTFDDGRIVALRPMSLTVEANDTVGLMGRSGSGKSTILNLMSGLDQPSSGIVRFFGQVVRDRTEWTRIRARHCGIVFQNFCLIPSLTACQNVVIAMSEGKPQARQVRALDLLASVGMAQRAHQLPNHLSGGERQRVAIARALANNPSLLLADEPTGSLDHESSRGVLELLETMRARHKAALVLVTHEVGIAAACRRQVHIADGGIIRDTP